MKYIVTHAGDAHWDDILAVGAAIYELGPVPVYRREPTLQELDDPEVLVLDTGMRFEPELNNYDHHQLGANSGETALTLFLKCRLPREYELLSAHHQVLNYVVRMDNLGPFRFNADKDNKSGKVLNLDVLTPLDAAVRRLFEKPEPEETTLVFLKELFIQHLLTASKRKLAVDDLKTARHYNVKGVRVVEVMSANPELLEVIDDNSYDIFVCFDNRGDGLMLYRNHDHPRVNFYKLLNHPEILFAHKSGFIAKTKSKNLSSSEVRKLLEAAIE